MVRLLVEILGVVGASASVTRHAGGCFEVLVFGKLGSVLNRRYLEVFSE